LAVTKSGNGRTGGVQVALPGDTILTWEQSATANNKMTAAKPATREHIFFER